MVTGVVASLHRWPVKSLGGEDADALQIDARGVGGDRAHALEVVLGGSSRRLTARQSAGMLAWRAAYPDAPGAALDPDDPPTPLITAPDGRTFAWNDPQLPRALYADLHRPIRLRRDLALMADLGDSILITVAASLRGVEAALRRPLDLRRFRTNIHVELDAPAFAEEGWQGRRLQVGEAQLDLLHPCERCVIPTRDPDNQERWPELLRWLAREHRTLFGINARALGAATVRVSDTVTI